MVDREKLLRRAEKRLSKKKQPIQASHGNPVIEEAARRGANKRPDQIVRDGRLPMAD